MRKLLPIVIIVTIMISLLGCDHQSEKKDVSPQGTDKLSNLHTEKPQETIFSSPEPTSLSTDDTNKPSGAKIKLLDENKIFDIPKAIPVDPSGDSQYLSIPSIVGSNIVFELDGEDYTLCYFGTNNYLLQSDEGKVYKFWDMSISAILRKVTGLEIDDCIMYSVIEGNKVHRLDTDISKKIMDIFIDVDIMPRIDDPEIEFTYLFENKLGANFELSESENIIYYLPTETFYDATEVCDELKSIMDLFQ